MLDDADRIYVRTAGRTIGPLTLRQFERHERHGTFGPDSPVSTDGIEWMSLRDFVEFNTEPTTSSEPGLPHEGIAPVATVSKPIPLLLGAPRSGIRGSFVSVGIVLAAGLLVGWLLFGHSAEAPLTNDDQATVATTNSEPPVPLVTETSAETNSREADEPTSTSPNSLPPTAEPASPASTEPTTKPEPSDGGDTTSPSAVRIPELEQLEQKYAIRIRAHQAMRPLMCGSWPIEGKSPSPKKLAKVAVPIFRELNLFPKRLIQRSGLQEIVLLAGTNLEKTFAGLACAEQQTILLDVEKASLYATMCRGKFGTVSHELFHIVDHADGDRLDGDPAWEKLNPDGFSYGKGGWNAERTPNLLKQDMSLAGFLNRYSMAAPAEDKAVLFETMIVDYRLVEYRTSRDKILKAKVALMKERLEKFCPEINSSFWYRMRRRYGDRSYRVELAESLKHVKQNPKSAAAQYNRGYTLLKNGYYSLALAVFRRARELPEAECMIVWVYSHLGDHKLAVHYANTLLDRELPPSSEITKLRGQALLLRGMSHFVRGGLPDAVADFTRAISADGDDVSAYWWGSHVLKQLGEQEASERDRHRIRALQNDP